MSLSASRWTALWIAAAWLLAPLLVSTVLYVTQRMAMLSALFVLAGLLGYVVGRERLAEGRRDGLAWILASVGLCLPLATLSKQNGVLLVPLALLVELFFFHADEARARRRALRTLAALLGLAAVAGLALVVTTPSSFFDAYQHRPFSMWERLLTEARVLFDYIGNLLLLPGAAPFGIYHDGYPVSRGLVSPPTTLLAASAWLAALAASWRWRHTAAGPALFGICFFLVAHLVESTVLPLEIYFEHRNYLPSVGVYLALGYGAERAVSHARSRRLVAVAIALVPLGFAAITVHRVLIWQSWERMLLAAERAYPDSTRVQTGLATLRMSRGELDEALDHLRKASSLLERPGLGLALHGLGAHCLAGQAPPPGAYDALTEADVVDDFHTVNAITWLADALERGRCPDLDVPRIADALHRQLGLDQGPGLYGQRWLLHTRTASLLASASRVRDALLHLDTASRLKPDRLEPGLLAVGHRLALGDVEDARATLADLRRRDRGRVDGHTRLIAEYERRLR